MLPGKTFFRADYLFRNWVYGVSSDLLNGLLDTGVGYYAANPSTKYFDRKSIFNPKYEFQLVDFINAPNNLSLLTPVLGSTESALIYYGRNLYEYSALEWPGDMGFDEFGISDTYRIISGSANLYGLPYVGATFAFADPPYVVQSVTVGETFDPALNGSYGSSFQQVSEPQFSEAGFYFAKKEDVWPGDVEFDVNTTSPLLIVPAGQVTSIAGWAKLGLVNGASGKYGYLGQYFAGAFKEDANGDYTVPKGVLSEYGEFFPTEPGRYHLKTMSDLVGTQNGEAEVYAIKMVVDFNGDGNMDATYSGSDNTSFARPYVFWINNDNDHEGVGQDVLGANVLPDNRDEEIKSQRDLEDFARLRIVGLPYLSVPDYKVTLSWANVGDGNPSIQIFQALETDGGTRYLTDVQTAGNHVTTSYRLAVGKVVPGSEFVIPASYFTAAGSKHWLFEGLSKGAGELILTVKRKDGAGIYQPVAQSSVFMKLVEIRDLYERVAISRASRDPQVTWNSSYSVQFNPQSLPDESKETVVFVHGYNMSELDYLNFSETMLKRLWWKGYRGRVAAVKWATPSIDDFTFFEAARGFNIGEFVALRSGRGLADYLKATRNNYPDRRISVCSHSTGAQVVAEALRLLAAEGQRPADNYAILQGALPAQCYDDTIGGQDFLAAELSKPTPNGYLSYASGIRNGLRGNIINFYNPFDWVLQVGVTDLTLALGLSISIETNWRINQLRAKPDSFSVGIPELASFIRATITPRSYGADSTSGWQQIVDANGSPVDTPHGRTITDPHEILSFVARSRSSAVGAATGVAGEVFGEVNLNTSVNDGGVVGFDRERDEHSGEFNWEIQKLDGFYRQLLNSLFP